MGWPEAFEIVESRFFERSRKVPYNLVKFLAISQEKISLEPKSRCHYRKIVEKNRPIVEY